MFNIFSKLKELIFPSHLKCVVCEKEIEDGKKKCLCEECFKQLPFIFHGCVKCGEKINGDYNICFSCKNCYRDFDKAYSVFEYSGLAKEMVWKIKYENCKYLAKTMASFLTDQIVKSDIKFDVLTCVPSSQKTKKKRGYNQAQLLAKEVACDLSIKLYDDVLLRIKENISQVELTAQERAKNIKNSFLVLNKQTIKNKIVLVIDDVLTTGATLSEIAKVLKNAGAKKVLGLTFANTTREIKFETNKGQIPTKREK